MADLLRTIRVANFSAFEVEEGILPNLREYALANSLYWALAEGHACEQSARRNAMDVRIPLMQCDIIVQLELEHRVETLDPTAPSNQFHSLIHIERLQERR